MKYRAAAAHLVKLQITSEIWPVPSIGQSVAAAVTAAVACHRVTPDPDLFNPLRLLVAFGGLASQHVKFNLFSSPCRQTP